MADPVWFWQRMVSPHMAGLAAALALRGRDVVYVAESELSAARLNQGWDVPDLGRARFYLAPTVDAIRQLVRRAPSSSVHICEGLRGNGLIAAAQRELHRTGLRQWIVMETVEDFGWRGRLRRIAYDRLVRRRRASLQGVLTIGHSASSWLIERGMPSNQVFPFAYFLRDSMGVRSTGAGVREGFRFLFVGQLVARKQIDLLLMALASARQRNFELTIVGAGDLEPTLREQAVHLLPGQVTWLGRRAMDEIPKLMAESDCLVLPSRHDGWGAVVSEALMVGTPAICSSSCGAAEVVHASGVGGVFASGGAASLTKMLDRTIAAGAPTVEQRADLAEWASCLGASAGARYLDAILSQAEGSLRPQPPWMAVPKPEYIRQ